MSTFEIRLTDGENNKWFDITCYDDFNEVAEEFVNDLEKDIDDVQEYIDENVYIDMIEDEFKQDYEYDGLESYYTHPDYDGKFGQGFIHDWDELKEEIEILEAADEANQLDPLIIYYKDSSCYDLEQAWGQLKDAYHGHYSSNSYYSAGALYAAEFYQSNYNIEDVESGGLVIDWEATWENMSMDMWETDGHIFRSL